MPIIESLLDNDLYKFTMMQAVYNEFDSETVEYEFKCRNGEDLRPFIDEINEEVDELCRLRFEEDELIYLKHLSYMQAPFIDFLRNFSFNRENIEVTATDKLNIIVKGKWISTILLEVPILAIVNEIYFRNTVKDPDYIGAAFRFTNKMEFARKNWIKFMEFGTRRRFSKEWQRRILKEIGLLGGASPIMGTSNVGFAKEFGYTPMGTMAHEWIMAGQALTKLADSQNFMLQKWQDIYRGELGIALTDTINSDIFLEDFDKYFANLYDGVRHDSGDPFEFGDKIVKHYNQLGIDPNAKTIIFSDGLDFRTARAVSLRYKGIINVVFGIGTYITNDFPGVNPLSIVMKMQRCCGQYVAKISDEPAKAQCQSEEYLDLLKITFGIG